MPSSPEASGQSDNRPLYDYPETHRRYAVPVPVHDALGDVVYTAELGGSKTTVNEMVAVLAYHAISHMDEDELTAAWLEYRKANLADLQRHLDTDPSQ